MKQKKKIFFFPSGIFPFFLVVAFSLISCSFDYNAFSESDERKPDIVMENIEYVRVRGGDPLVRFHAEYAERWEDTQTMELQSFTFEQMENSGETINAEGAAGAALVELDSGNVALSGGVRISVDSEDISISTSILQWRDRERTLTSGPEDRVDIERSDGTSFSGEGFFADARSWTWTFSGEVRGTYVEEEEEPQETEPGDR